MDTLDWSGMKSNIFCAGQGSQKLEMGKELYLNNEQFKHVVDELALTTKYPLVELLTTIDHDINELGNTQIAVVAFDYALGKIIGQNKNVESYAGLSLGEFAALALNGVIKQNDLLPLIEKRIDAMNTCLNGNPGMLAVIGAPIEVLKDLVAKFDEIYIANYNSHKQIVCAGDKEQIGQLKEALKENGIKRAIELNVKGAFHTPFMKPAAEQFASALNEFDFETTSIKTYSNVTAQLHTPETLKENLVKHLFSPVMFYQTVESIPSTQE
jgi:[acyl-carrier-protein] S-malonyltransferase